MRPRGDTSSAHGQVRVGTAPEAKIQDQCRNHDTRVAPATRTNAAVMPRRTKCAEKCPKSIGMVIAFCLAGRDANEVLIQCQLSTS